MPQSVKKVGKYTVKVVKTKKAVTATISSRDMEMDNRAKAAVKSAIEKAEVCHKPIARYDLAKKKAYVEQADGVKEYVD